MQAATHAAGGASLGAPSHVSLSFGSNIVNLENDVTVKKHISLDEEAPPSVALRAVSATAYTTFPESSHLVWFVAELFKFNKRRQ